jgi:V/A-type H+-transporting ATPase subunit E
VKVVANNAERVFFFSLPSGIVETTFLSEKNKAGIHMALQIQDLVASIRKDGVEAGKQDAEKIIADAKQQAERIIQQARKDADAAVAQAQRDIEVRDKSARASLQQAGRDVELSLKKAITAELDGILQAKVTKLFDGKELADLIASVVKSGMVDGKTSEIQVNKKQYAALAQSLKAELGDAMHAGLVIRPVDNVDTGFRVADKDGSGFYDFSAEEIASLMRPFLGEELSEIVFAPAK